MKNNLRAILGTLCAGAFEKANPVKKFAFTTLFTLTALLANAQTSVTVIDPNGAGGFELGATAAANGWSVVNPGGGALWQVGTAAFASGTRAAYVSNDGGASVSYNQSPPDVRVCHLYRTITIPADGGCVTLSFSLQSTGEEDYDYLTVYNLHSSSPQPGNTDDADIAGATLLFDQNDVGYLTSFATQTITISGVAGTTFTLDFQWQNDESVSDGPPAIVDNISLTYTKIPAISGNLSVCAGGTTQLSGYAAGTWTSSTSSIATVNLTTGLVSGTAAGTTNITFSRNICGSSVKSVAQVSVVQSPSALSVSPGSATVCTSGPAQLLTATGGTYSGTANVPGTQTRSTGTISVTLAQNAATTSVLNVPAGTIPAGATITSMSLNLNSLDNGTHRQRDDSWVLFGPNGNRICLSDGQGDNTTGQGYTNVTYSSTATDPLPNTDLSNGTWAANLGNGIPTNVSAANRSNSTAWSSVWGTPNGNWTLMGVTGRNTNATNYSRITSWSITINYTLPTPVTLQAPVTWSPATGLYTDAAATIPYVAGSGATAVYALPSGNTSYTASVACGVSATPVSISVPAVPALTGFTTFQSKCFSTSAQTATFNYTGVVSGADQYKLVWPAGSPFSDVASFTALPGTGTGFVVNIPASATAAIYVPTLTVRNSATTCASSYTPTLVVQAVPTTPVITPGTSITSCIGATVNLTASSTAFGPLPSSAFTWVAVGGAPAPSCANCNNPSVTNSSLGAKVYSVTATENGCSATVGVTITVGATPGIIGGTSPICPTGISTYDGTPSGGTWSSGNPSVATVFDGDVTAVGQAGGTATISYNYSGCVATAVQVINPGPSAITILPNTASSVCLGSGVTFTASSISPFGGVILSQNFNTGLTGQVGGTWSIPAGSGDASSWFMLTTPPGYSGDIDGDGTQYMQASSDAFIGTNLTTFVSPAFSTVGLTSAVLTYNQDYEAYGDDINVDVQYSLDGVSWNPTPVVNQLGSDDINLTWSVGAPTVSQALPAGAIGQPTVYLRWRYSSDFGLWWTIDNIVVTGTAAPLPFTWTGATAGTDMSCTNCANPTITPTTNGNHIYSVTTSYGSCSVTSGVSVFATNTAPTAPVVTPATSKCNEISIGWGGGTGATNFEVTVSTNPSITGGIVYGPVLVGNVLTHTISGLSGNTTYYYRIIGSNTCGGNGPATISSIATTPTPAVTPGSSPICSGLTSTWTASPAGGTWTSAAPSVASVPTGPSTTGVVTGVGIGSTVITYAAGGCYATGTQVVTAAAFPPSFVITPAIANICAGGSQQLTVPAVAAGGGTASFDFAGPAVTITAASPSNNTATVVVNTLPASATITSMQVRLHPLQHTYRSDLGIAIVAPNGQILGLCNGRGDDANHFADVTFVSDGSGTPIASMGTGNNVTGTFNAELTTTSGNTNYMTAPTTANWSDLFSIPNGNWTLQIRDNYTDDGGSLAANALTLTFTYTTPAANYVWNNTTGLFTDPSLTTAYVANTPATTVYASPAATVTYSATATYSGFTCPTQKTVTVSVTPLPTSQTVTGTGTGCASTGVAVGLANSQTGVNYQLFRNGASVGSPVAGNTGNSISFGAQTTAGTYTVLATYASGLGCPRAMTGSAVVTIVANPTAQTMTGGGTACANVGVELGMANSQTGVNYTLFRGSTNTGIVVPGNTGNAITFGFQTTAGTYTVSASNATSPACPTDMPDSKVVNINPLPNVTALSAAATSPCLGNASTATLTSANLVNGTAYTVNYTLSGASGNNATANTSMTFGAGTGTFTIVSANLGNAGATTVTVNSVTATATGCAAGVTGVSGNFTVKTVPGAITGGNTICFGAGTTTANLTNSAVLGTWSSSNVTAATVNTTTGVATSTGQGVTTITYDNGCAPAATMSMTVNATPAATIGGANTLCFGAGTSTTTATNTSTNGTWSSSNAGVATINTTTGAITSAGQGTTTISYNNGCGAAATKSMTVNATPDATITGASTLCFGSGTATTTLGNTATNGTWSSSNNGVATVNTTSGVVTSTGQGTVNISYDNGCGAAAVKSMTVNATPVATITGASTLCFDGGVTTTTLGNTSTNGTWSSNNNSVATVNTTSGVVTSAGQGTVTISYDNGCGAAATKSMTVNATPAVIGGASTLCFGSGTTTTTLTNTSTNGTWSSSTPGVAGVNMTSGLVTSASQGVTTISYDNGCGAAATKSMTVNATPAAIAGANTICFGGGTTTTTLTNTSTNGTWSSSNVAAATMGLTNGVATGAGQGITTISYDNGCGLAATMSMTVNATPAAITGNAPICAGGVTLNLANTSTNGTWSSSAPATASVSSAGVVTSGAVGGTAIISYDNGCGSAAEATVTVNALPATVSVSGGGLHCDQATLVAANGADGTIYFQGTTSGGTSTATPSTSEVVTASNTYYFRARSAAGCWGPEGSATVTIGITPDPVAVAGSGSYCGNATITASGGANGTIYYQGTTSGGTSTLTPSVSQVISSPGIYYFRAMSADGCWGAEGSATVTALPLPVIHTFTGGGGYCDGGTGVSIGLTLSETGINYQLFQGTTPVSAIMPGTTGSPITFGTAYVAPGYYYAIATNTTTGCTATLPGVTVHINPLPDVFNVTGGGSYCSSGGTGVEVGMDNSAVGIDYQLYNGTTLVATESGTGGPISFGPQPAGLYTAKAVNTATGCEIAMAGSATVDFYPSPTVHNVLGGGTYCLGGPGVNVSLDGSDLGIDYQLIYGGFIPIGGAIDGTGAGLDMGNHFLPGDYTVVARDTTTGCTDTMNSDAQINFALPPVPFFVGGGGGYCAGDPGVNVTLSGSQLGVRYQVYDNAGAPVGSAVNGTGTALDFGLFTTVGTYTVQATDTTTGCTSNMLFSATVTMNPVVIPTVSLNTGVGTDNRVCFGNPVTFTAVTTNGGTTPAYEWKINNITVPGTDIYTYVPVDGDVVWVRMTSSTACAVPAQAMDTMVVDVDTVATPSVFLTVDPITSVPTGTTVTFTAHVTNGGPAPAFRWFKNGAVIPTATTSVYATNNLANKDSIMVEVTTSGGCGGMVTVNGVRITVYGVGVPTTNAKVSDVRLIPNPNKGTFSVTGTLSTTEDAEVDLDVVNMLGQSVYKGKVTAKNGQINEQIQLSGNLANGMYMLNLQSGEDRKVFHFVLEQ